MKRSNWFYVSTLWGMLSRKVSESYSSISSTRNLRLTCYLPEAKMICCTVWLSQFDHSVKVRWKYTGLTEGESYIPLHHASSPTLLVVRYKSTSPTTVFLLVPPSWYASLRSINSFAIASLFSSQSSAVNGLLITSKDVSENGWHVLDII